MKSILLSAVALLCLPATASADTFAFDGAAVIYAVSSKCDSGLVGERHFARFAPANLGGNDAAAAFAWFQFGRAQSFALSTGSFTTTAKSVTYRITNFKVWWPDFAVKVKFSSQDPATITTSSKFIDVTGMVYNYDETNGCNASFRMTLTRKP